MQQSWADIEKHIMDTSIQRWYVRKLLHVVQNLQTSMPAAHVSSLFWVYAQRWFKVVGLFLMHHLPNARLKHDTCSPDKPHETDVFKLAQRFLMLGRRLPWLTIGQLPTYAVIQQAMWRHNGMVPWHHDAKAPVSFSRNVFGAIRLKWRSLGVFSQPHRDTVFPWLFRGHHARHSWSHRGLQWQQLLCHPILVLQHRHARVWTTEMYMHLAHWLQLWRTEQQWLQDQRSFLWTWWSRHTQKMLGHAMLFNQQQMQDMLKCILPMMASDGMFDAHRHLWVTPFKQCVPFMNVATQKMKQFHRIQACTAKKEHGVSSEVISDEKKHAEIARIRQMESNRSKSTSWMPKKEQGQSVQAQHERCVASSHRYKYIMTCLSLIHASKKHHMHQLGSKSLGGVIEALGAFMRPNTLPTKSSCALILRVIQQGQKTIPRSSWQGIQAYIQRCMLEDAPWHSRHQWVADHVLSAQNAKAYFQKHWQAWLALPNDAGHTSAIDHGVVHHGFYHQLVPWRYGTLAARKHIIMEKVEPSTPRWWQKCWQRLTSSCCPKKTPMKAPLSQDMDWFLDRMARINVRGEHAFMNTVADHWLCPIQHEATCHQRVATWLVWRQLFDAVKKKQLLCHINRVSPIMRRLLWVYTKTKGFQSEPKLQQYFIGMLEIVIEMMCVAVLKKISTHRRIMPYRQVSIWVGRICKVLPKPILRRLKQHVSDLLAVPALLAFDLKTFKKRLACLKYCRHVSNMESVVDRRLVFILRHPYFSKIASSIRTELLAIAQHCPPAQRRLFETCANLPSAKHPLLPNMTLLQHFASRKDHMPLIDLSDVVHQKTILTTNNTNTI